MKAFLQSESYFVSQKNDITLLSILHHLLVMNFKEELAMNLVSLVSAWKYFSDV